jgi:hypothetical protein
MNCICEWKIAPLQVAIVRIVREKIAYCHPGLEIQICSGIAQTQESIT